MGEMDDGPNILGRGYEIVHLDSQLIVINKSCGILSVPGIGPEKADCIAMRVAAEFAGARRAST
jgi:tRNA pseudouridine32 synthase / 23S rRNA pseudouridine746 synthase